MSWPRGIGRREVLGDENLRVVGVHRRQRLADDERGPGLVGLQQGDRLLTRYAAAPTSRGIAIRNGSHLKRIGELAPEIHGV